MTQNNVQHCGLACTVTRTAVVGGKRHLRLGFVFPTEKGSTPSVLAVLVLCLRLLAFVTVLRDGHLASASSGCNLHTLHV